MMKTRGWLGIFLAAVVIVSAGGCSSSGTETSDSSTISTSDDSSTSGDDSSASSSTDTSQFAVSYAETAGTYDPEDDLDNVTFDDVIDIDFTENTARLSSATAQAITSDGVTLLAADGGTVIVAATEYGVTISSSVDAKIRYNLTGELNGTLSVSSAGDYQLYLDGVTIIGTAGPALDLESSQKVFIATASGSTNMLLDSATRSMTMKAALYGKGPMIFSGDGTLLITGSYKHGIFSNDYIRVRAGELDVAVSAKDAIRSVNGFIFDDGDLTINATGTVTDDESKGIKVEGSEGSNGVEKGYIVINGGYIDITSVGKAITAGWDIDEDAETVDTSDDPSPYVEINNGVISITTTGTPYEYESGGTTVSCSPEGIEAKSDLTINNGYLTISTTDDGLNAGNSITINGGYLYCASSLNDAVDSNGSLTISGGVIVAIGASVPEGAFDCDQNTFAITGGTLVGIGGALSTPTAAACTQNVVILGRGTQGSTFCVKAEDGTVAFVFTIPQSYTTMVLSTPDIEIGTRYTTYTSGIASGDESFYGLYLGNLSYSQGTAGTSFTVSSRVTNIGSR